MDEMTFGKSKNGSHDLVRGTLSSGPPKDPNAYFKGGSQVKQLKGLRVGAWGSQGTGKSHCALTFPKPIFAVNTDFGMYPLLEEKEFAVWCKPYTEEDWIRIFEAGVLDETSAEPDPLRSLQATEEALTALAGASQGTIVLDSGEDIWSWIGTWLEEVATKRSEKTGEKYQYEWGKANARYRLLMMRILSKPMNFVITGQSQAVYDEHGKVVPGTKADWQKKTPYWVDLELEMQRRTDGVFQAKVRKCRLGANKKDLIINPTYENIVKWIKEEFPERTIFTQGITKLEDVMKPLEVQPVV